MSNGEGLLNKIFSEINLIPIDSIDSNVKHVNLYKIDKNSNFKILNMKLNDDVGVKQDKILIRFNDIGGLNNEIELIKDLFIRPFDLASVYKDIGKFFFKKRV
jgi:ATP-dependent 26S proteasome regulatory subunit